MKHFYFLSLIFAFSFSQTTIAQCSIPTPDFSVGSPGCQGAGSIFLNNLPDGYWTVHGSNGTESFTITEIGSYYNVEGLAPGFYTVYVVDESGCTSGYIYADVTPMYEWEANLAGVYDDTNANGIADVGDVINYTVTVTNPFGCEITGVETTLFSNSFGLSGVLIPTVAANSTATYNFSFIMTQPYINIGFVSGYIYLTGNIPGLGLSKEIHADTDLDIPDGLLLNAFVDANGNGVRDGIEPIFSGGMFNVAINNGGIVHYGSSGSQCHLYETNPLTTYDLSLSIDDLYCPGSYSCAVNYNDLTVLAGSGITTINFPVTATPCENVGVSLQSGGGVPGSTHWNYITIRNHGNGAGYSGTITYTMPPMATIVSVSDPAAVLTPTGFTLTYSNLLANEIRHIAIWLDLPPFPAVMLGDVITSTVSTTVPATDSTLSDNSASITYPIVASYDPNDKHEIHGGQIAFSEFSSADYLTYTVNFENTGNGPATNISITDVLNAALDAETFQLLDSSHPCTYQRAGNDLDFTFSGIGLQPNAHGFVTFQIKPAAGYAVGDIIENTASIYFDTNPAIVTNTVTTEFVNVLGTPESSLDDLKIYPNPANSILNITTTDIIETIEVRDILGKPMLSLAPHSTSAALNVSGLAHGVYFANITSAGKQKTIKFIKG